MQKFKSFLSNSSKPTKIAFFSIIIFIIFIIIFLFLLTTAQDSHISINNFTSSTTAPSGYQKYIEDTIWNTIKDQPNVTSNSIKTATIRDNSISETTDNHITTTSFLVDLASLHYTFRVTFSWDSQQKQVGSDPFISVHCPDSHEIIYDDFICPIDISIAIKDHLPHEEHLHDNTQINITLNRYASYQSHAGESYLLVSLPICQSYSQLTETRDLTRQWLDSLHLNSTNLHIEVVCNNCPLNNTLDNIDHCHLLSEESANSNLLNFLPYADENFKIEPSDNPDKKLKIILFIDRASPYYPNKIEELEAAYLEQALNWIKSRGFDPTNYPYETITEFL